MRKGEPSRETAWLEGVLKALTRGPRVLQRPFSDLEIHHISVNVEEAATREKMRQDR